MFNFQVRMKSGSTELAKVKALTTGAVTFGLTGGTKGMTVSMPSMGYRVAELGEVDGKVTVSITGSPLDNGTDPVVSVVVDNT
jgi:hypothetical protein